MDPELTVTAVKLAKIDFRVFNIWDIDKRCYLEWDDVIQITDAIGINRVPTLYRGKLTDEFASVKSLLEYAEKQEYAKNVPAEGIVIKTDKTNDPKFRYSFKVISNKYLLKNDT